MLHPFRWIVTNTNIETGNIILMLLFLCQIKPTIQHGSEYSIAHTNLDEEIIIDPNHDHDTAAQANDDNRGGHSDNIAPHKLPSLVQMFDQYDPFSVTFEDYLKEASKSSSSKLQHVAAHEKASSASPIPDAAGLIIEDDENSIRKKETPIIDYIFPSSTNEKKTQAELEHKQVDSPGNTNELIKDIKLFFAWKHLPTNKCSKTCGKGFRLNHIFCVDLKYAVRVEDELCVKTGLTRPNLTNDDPCNEIDCPPAWTSVKFQECSSDGVRDGFCRPVLYEKTQCVMINREGASIHLADSKCSGDANLTERVQSREFRDQNIEEDSIELNLDDQVESNQKNDILSNIDVGASIDEIGKSSKSPPHNEPFFEAGTWSECSGAPCGQLGKRYRKLTCRLYLSRSSKFADLPDSGCQHSPKPEHQELCYIDCPPEETLKEGSDQNGTTSAADTEDSQDEFVYDSEMARYIWRRDGWTKCSAECLGGEQETFFDCWDKVAETTVSSDLCDPDLKPQLSTQRCNEVPCAPDWHVENFTKCTRNCGSAGTRSRTVLCMQQVPSKDGPLHLVVSNDLCLQAGKPLPIRIEPCNRVDCRPEWSVGPWSDCSKKCGIGIRNRTVMCVQEFASKEGLSSVSNVQKQANPDLVEAMAISAKDWHPGKATQVPFHECYEEYRTIPTLDEKCFNYCENEPYIDADTHQNYRLTHESMKRKSITIKVGGVAQILEGKNLKIRCKIINRQNKDNLVKVASDQVEWQKDGIKIFVNGSTVVERSSINEDNSIFGNDVIIDDKEYMADQPHQRRTSKVTTKRSNPRARNSLLRSLNNLQNSYIATQSSSIFTPQKGGRFSLIKENTLRIKRLKPDDSGLYTCNYGNLSESVELSVISRRDFMSRLDKYYESS